MSGDDPVAIEFEVEKWDLLCTWLRERENGVRYAPWRLPEARNVLFAIRTEIEAQTSVRDRSEEEDPFQTVSLYRWEWNEISTLLRRRSIALLAKPWRDRERRDVRNLRAHLLSQLDRSG